MNSLENNNTNDKGFFADISWKSAVIYALLTLTLGATGGAGLVATKGVQPVAAQDFENKYATKAEKDEIWRFINDRIKLRAEKDAEILSVMARKDNIQNLRSIMDIQTQKNDEQIRMLQEQNKLMQELIRLNR